MAKRDKQSRSSDNERQGPGALTLSLGFFVSGILVTVLAFISLQAAAMALGFMALASFVLFDSNQRRFWEQKTTRKIKNLAEGQEQIAGEVERQRHDLITVREEMDEAIINLGSEGRGELLVDDPRPGRMSLDHDPIPRAMKPGSAANEDRLTDQSILSDTVVKELIHNAVRNKRIDVFVQPVVRLPQRRTRFYEIFARIRAKPGMYLPAGRYMEMARQEKLMNEIDYLLLMQCLKTIKSTEHIDRAAPFFINITTATLGNVTFMKKLLNFLAANRTLAPRLVFEIRQKDYSAMKPAILEILRGLSKLGCSLSMDNVENLNFDLKMLQVLKVRFIKVNAKILLQKSKSDKEFLTVMKVKKQLEGNGIGFIVEKLENEYTLKELMDYDLNYGQGFLFGKPDLQAAYQRRAAGAA